MVFSRTFLCAVSAALFVSSNAVAQTICNDGEAVPGELSWAAGDTGHNEGADCGLQALGGAGVGLPATTFGAAGEVFKRNAMMQTAINAYKAGFQEQAINAAICSAVHNPAAHVCLSQHRDLVGYWLSTH